MELNLIKKYFKLFFTFGLVFILLDYSLALEVPAPAGTPLHDKAGILSREEKTKLKSQLLNIDSRGAFQAGVLIIRDLENTDIESYAVEVFEKWQLGKKARTTGFW